MKRYFIEDNSCYEILWVDYGDGSFRRLADRLNRLSPDRDWEFYESDIKTCNVYEAIRYHGCTYRMIDISEDDLFLMAL